MTEDQLFLAALDQPNAVARNAYLDEACGNDATLRGKVESLLAAHFQSGEFLDIPAPEQVCIDTGPSCAVTIQNGSMSDHNRDDQADDSESLKFLAPSSRPDSLGRIGHYEVLQVLGKGGFGIVLRAFDDVLQRVVAIKVMAPQMAATSPARKRFLREARSSAAVRHEHIVQVYEVGEHPLPYLVMEFIPGETLQQRIDRVGPLEVKEALQIGRQIAEGLAAAHVEDLIHRDIKPGNVLLEGTQHKVKITDFGLARAADDASMTQSGMIAGTPMYMAPEQALGQTLDQRADLFSLGSVMYQMVAGRPPFRASTTIAVLKRVADDAPRPIREVIPETPQWLCDIIAKLHAKNPDDRYQSAREVADVLADCEAQLKQSSRLQDFSRIPRSGTRSSQSWKWAVAAALALLPLVALVVTELTGVTHLFRGPAPITNNPQSDPITEAKFGPTADGFVPLFNGKDLSGWKTHPDQPGSWSVANGVLVGSGSVSHLFSDREDYSDFELRVEARISHPGDSGILFRTEYGLSRHRTQSGKQEPDGYEAQICYTLPPAWKTGSLIGPDERTALFPITRNVIRPDEWFTMSVVARDNEIVVRVNGQTLVKHSDTARRYARGHIALQVFDNDTIVEFRKIEIKELPATPPPADGFVQLFNSKDLTGWKTHPEQPGNWDVTNGILVGHTSRSHLFTERDDFANFHFRAELKLNQGGDSGIRFRAPFALARGEEAWQVQPGGGYEAEFNRFPGSSTQTGSVQRANPPLPPSKLFRAEPGLLVLADEWATYEVIADGNRIITKLNGREVANCVDPDSMYSRGHIALQCFNSQTVVQFRKIEIKALPPSPPVADGFVQLFNGKDLTGWKTHSLSGGEWKVVDGAIDGRGNTSYLFSDSGDYDNFQLRVEAKVNGNGDAGVCFRTPYDVKGLRQEGPAKFGLLGGYEAAIAARPNYANNSGSLTAADGTTLQAGPPLPHQPDQWFVLEVIADGNHIRTLVDGKPIVDYVDEERHASRGHLALQVWGPNVTSVQFRKIEIKGLPASPPVSPRSLAAFTDADVQRIGALPAADQVEAVRKELMRLNPGFDGKVTPTIENGVVTEFSVNTDEILNVAPVRALAKLVYLDLRGTYPNQGKLTDLSPLQGLPLTRLHIDGTGVSDLRPLEGMPLVEFRLNPRNITQGMDAVRGLKTIQTIGTPGNQTWKPEEFWQRYDKGEFK